jgi:DNA-binding NtrC family response regulator
MRDGRYPPARVLVVDDEPHLLEVLEDSLTELEYATRGVGTRPEALRLLATSSLVLLDLALPGRTRERVLGRLREANFYFPAIMVTGASDPVVGRFAGARAFDYIEKPFSLTRLKQVLEGRSPIGAEG